MPRKSEDKREANEIALELGKRVRAKRDHLGWTQELTAERVNLSTEAYGRIERGSSLPSFPTFLRMCRCLDATPDELLGFDDGGDQTEPKLDNKARTISLIAEHLADLDQELVEGLADLVRVLWGRR